MPTTRADIEAWLGDYASEVTDEQTEALVGAADAIEARWPDPDDRDSRELALSAAAQVILGDDTLEVIAAAWQQARRVERERMDSLTGALLVTPGSERVLAERAGVARMTVRKALGRGIARSRV